MALKLQICLSFVVVLHFHQNLFTNDLNDIEKFSKMTSNQFKAPTSGKFLRRVVV